MSGTFQRLVETAAIVSSDVRASPKIHVRSGMDLWISEVILTGLRNCVLPFLVILVVCLKLERLLVAFDLPKATGAMVHQAKLLQKSVYSRVVVLSMV